MQKPQKRDKNRKKHSNSFCGFCETFAAFAFYLLMQPAKEKAAVRRFSLDPRLRGDDDIT
jgi:hypothetical protein